MLLSAQNVKRSYHAKYQRVQAVRNMSRELKPGKLSADTGESGRGKTTLLSLLAGLELSETGSVLLDGGSLCEMNIDRYGKSHCAVIYRHFNLFPLLSVKDKLPLNRRSKTRALACAKKTLGRFGQSEAYSKRLPEMLSRGEQQRAAITRAPAAAAKLNLADEPSGNLAAENMRSIVERLLTLAYSQRLCILTATHNPDTAGEGGPSVEHEQRAHCGGTV